jgi:hypothetical protein
LTRIYLLFQDGMVIIVGYRAIGKARGPFRNGKYYRLCHGHKSGDDEGSNRRGVELKGESNERYKVFDRFPKLLFEAPGP